MDKLLVICGPTATGKTDLAIKLCQKFSGEIVSADSRQVYRDLDIGTGKAGLGQTVQKNDGFWIVDEVKINLYDVVSACEQFDLANFIGLAVSCINHIWHEGKLPLVVGGTGFYIKGLLEGVESLGIEPNLSLRQDLLRLTVDQKRDKLQELDINKWNNLNLSDRKNPRRLIRAIEIAQNAKSGFSRPTQYNPLAKADVLKIGLTAPRAMLFDKTDQWVVSRLAGILQEVENLKETGVTDQRLAELGFVYKLANLVKIGELTLKQFESELKKAMRHYVTRQLTWFKKDRQIAWFDITNSGFFVQVEQALAKWYNK